MALIAYKCPNCGGEIRFDPSTRQYRCEYCMSLFTQEELDAEQAKEADEAARKGISPEAGAEGEEPLVYSCPSCGAQIVTTATTAASVCYYCHTPVVLSGRFKGSYHPDKIIPFAIDRKKALEIFDGWIRQKKYVPDAFYSKSQIDTMTGVYFPYWLYGCRVDGKLSAQGTKLTEWTAGNVRFTKTEVYDVSRDGNMEIKNLTRNALSTANHKLVENVLPFDMTKLEDFNLDYLAGFMAENRDMEQDAFREQVENEVKDFAQSSLRNEISSGYSSVQVVDQEMKLRDVSWQYALLPVWTLTYKEPGSGKIYYFACNGSTGKVCGELPVDQGKLWRLFAMIFVPVFAVLMLFWYFI